ncbi:FAD-dependent oxidoreductase [Niabella yanshanensis]|uniref:FAD-dependent oxidoreductase n=1 Tax=Niabella yanshanensis TaxID=577386 RepID=A0ABZ0WAT5_9BACT|nr:FAD-dependent oxidoreductase [Niabella yanshanensis]WQD39612.1 FAD-dependent oxidoreductase [Niabella yanshanensis]
MKYEKQVVIIGGGLSGLTLAYLLSKQNIKATILEAAQRWGGRIQTVRGKNDTPLELGATWFSDMHPNLISLIDDLGLKRFPQFSKGISLFQTKSFEPPQEFFVPEAETPSYRIAGGTQMLTDSLVAKLSQENLQLNTKAVSIKQTERALVVETEDGTLLSASHVAICIPPQLAAQTIRFDPVLPFNLCEVLPTVQTWMAGAIKFVLEYDTPFWRNNGYSGMLYSHAGIIVEMYDHTNAEQNRFGFTGFLNASAAAYTYEVRREYTLRQLTELMGENASNPLTYHDKIWNEEYLIAGNPIIMRPHQNNGHPFLQESYMEDRLHFCNTETATEFAGYMEGAVVAARSLSEKMPAQYN